MRSLSRIFDVGGWLSCTFKIAPAVSGDWILSSGFWDDSSVWDDTATWNG